MYIALQYLYPLAHSEAQIFPAVNTMLCFVNIALSPCVRYN